jgi:hypothetical protein
LFKPEYVLSRSVISLVKYVAPLLFACLLLTGCATSTVESRKRERSAGFAALSPEFKQLVSNGQIRRGMSEDAVYIAWGKPAQVLQHEDQGGLAIIWVYLGGWMQETRYWYPYRRFPETDYQPRTYVRAEITFVNGVVSTWQTLPQPLD